MRRIGLSVGIIAAIALANPARAALQLPHNFFDDPTPRPTAMGFATSGNLPHELGAMRNDGLRGQIISFAAPVPRSFQLTENDFPFGGNGFPLFNVRHDPEHDFYNILTAQITSVPESSTWMMLLLGFAAVGFAMRRNRRDFRLPAMDCLEAIGAC